MKSAEEQGGAGSGSSFFVAFRVLPPERRAGIEAVYRFCRDADDAVDLASDRGSAERALARVGARLDALYGEAAVEPADEALACAIERFELPRQPFDDLIEGVSWDLEGRRYANRADLRRYCYRVASTVGLLCVRVFGCREDSCDRYAEELGVALQWTNILRDIGTDLRAGRVYLPERSLADHHLTVADLKRPDDAARERISALVREEAGYARERFAEARRLLPTAERGRVLAGEIMGAVYRCLLGQVERAGHRVLEGVVRVSGLRRAWIAAGLILRYRVARVSRDPR